MALRIFYSWQSDTEAKVNRNFIEDALKRVAKALSDDPEVIPALREYGGTAEVDSDTKKVPGSPEIANVIFEKISSADIYVADLTFVGSTEQGRKLSNPNVLIEYGWALSKLRDKRIITLMNGSYGAPTWDTLPFNLRHRRFPIVYILHPDEDTEKKREVRDALIADLIVAMRLIVDAGFGAPEENSAFAEKQPASSPSTFLVEGEALGLTEDPHDSGRELRNVGEQRAFLRLMPTLSVPRIESTTGLKEKIRDGLLLPLGTPYIGSYGRNEYGAFVCSNGDNGNIPNFTQVFKSKEIWGVDSFLLDKHRSMAWTSQRFGHIPCAALEEEFKCALANYMKFARDQFGLECPLRFIAGVAGIKGFRMAAPSGMNFGGQKFGGLVTEDEIIHEGRISSYDETPAELLLPFFEKVWDVCGLRRPQRATLG